MSELADAMQQNRKQSRIVRSPDSAPRRVRQMKMDMENSIREAVNPLIWEFAEDTGLWPNVITLKINVGTDVFTKRVHGDIPVVKVEKVESEIVV
jgi:hypothetical protein